MSISCINTVVGKSRTVAGPVVERRMYRSLDAECVDRKLAGDDAANHVRAAKLRLERMVIVSDEMDLNRLRASFDSIPIGKMKNQCFHAIAQRTIAKMETA